MAGGRPAGFGLHGPGQERTGRPRICSPFASRGVPMSASRQDDRGIYLVQPKFPPSYWGLEHFMALTPFHAVFPPLGLLTLAALTPPEFRVSLCDENAGEEVDYNTSAALVGITGYIIQDSRDAA